MAQRMVDVRVTRAFNERRVRYQPRRILTVTHDKARRLLAQRNVELVKGQFPPRPPALGAVVSRADAYPVCPYSQVNRAWEGETVVILGGGPSLSRDHVEYCRGKVRLVAVNNAYLLAPWADVIYFADLRWHGWHADKSEFKALSGPLVTLENIKLPAKDARIHCLRVGKSRLLSERPDTLNTGSNGGFQAVNLCVLAGVRRIVLLGFDMRAVGRQTHWHPEHPAKTSISVYQNLMLPRFATAVPQLRKLGVKVINATPGSALRCFTMDTLENALKTD